MTRPVHNPTYLGLTQLINFKRCLCRVDELCREFTPLGEHHVYKDGYTYLLLECKIICRKNVTYEGPPPVVTVFNVHKKRINMSRSHVGTMFPKNM